MVQLLLLGDLHLSTTGPPVPPACPDLDSLDVDGVVSIGDIIDDNQDHADDASSGATYEERGRDFFAGLNELGVPIVAVPGNHDPVACTRRLADGLDNVEVAHRRILDFETLLEEPFDDISVVGWGCEQFDLTPAFQYDQYPGIVPKYRDTSNITEIAGDSAATVEAVVSKLLSGELDANAAATALGVTSDNQAACTKELRTLVDEYEAIREVLAEARGTTLFLSHETPFNVDFDYHHSTIGLEKQLHRGSIPIKMAIAATGPDVVFTGHMHTEGRDVIETVRGYADLYNSGSPGVAIVEIDPDNGSLHSVSSLNQH